MRSTCVSIPKYCKVTVVCTWKNYVNLLKLKKFIQRIFCIAQWRCRYDQHLIRIIWVNVHNTCRKCHFMAYYFFFILMLRLTAYKIYIHTYYFSSWWETRFWTRAWSGQQSSLGYSSQTSLHVEWRYTFCTWYNNIEELLYLLLCVS